jgi:hypothetical protein
MIMGDTLFRTRLAPFLHLTAPFLHLLARGGAGSSLVEICTASDGSVGIVPHNRDFYAHTPHDCGFYTHTKSTARARALVLLLHDGSRY